MCLQSSVIWVSLFAPGLWSAIWVSFFSQQVSGKGYLSVLGHVSVWVKNESVWSVMTTCNGIFKWHPWDIFTHLKRLLTISNRGRIAGVCCPNQIKNHHFVICRTLTSYLSLNFIITNNHTELQSPRGRRFCLLCWSTFYGTIQGYTKRGRI